MVVALLIKSKKDQKVTFECGFSQTLTYNVRRASFNGTGLTGFQLHGGLKKLRHWVVLAGETCGATACCKMYVKRMDICRFLPCKSAFETKFKSCSFIMQRNEILTVFIG